MTLLYSLEPVNVKGDKKRKRVKKVNISKFVGVTAEYPATRSCTP